MIKGPRKHLAGPAVHVTEAADNAARLRRMGEASRRRHVPPSPQVFAPAPNLTPRFKLPYGDLDGALVQLDTLLFGGWAPRVTLVSPLTRVWAYFGGYNFDGSQSPNGTITLNGGNGTWYVQRTPAGVVTADAALDTSKIPMARVVVTGGAIVSFNDIRDLAFAALATALGLKITNPMTTLGDLIVGGVAGVPGVLSVAAIPDGYVVTKAAGVPAWVAPGGGGGSSSQFLKAILQCHFDGANGSTVFTDAALGQTLTKTGSPIISTAKSVFGGSSIQFTGSTDKLTLANNIHNKWFPADTFDIAFRIWTTQTGIQDTAIIERITTSSFNVGSDFFVSFNTSSTTNGKISFWHIAINNAAPALTSTVAINDGVWHAIRIIGIGTWRGLFVDGVLQDQRATQAGYIATTNAQDLTIGNTKVFSGRAFVGFLDELRIVMGGCDVTRDYTPETSAFPDA